MFSSRSCALRSEFISSSSRACGAAEGAAHAQRAQPHSPRPPPGPRLVRPRLARPLTWEMPDSNSSGFSPLGLTILALELNMAGTWKHRALRASGRPHPPPAQAIGTPGPDNRPHPHPGAPDVCPPKPADRHGARGPCTLQRRPKILAAADSSRPRKRPRSRESSLNPGGRGEEAGIARIEKPEEPLRRGGSLESRRKGLLRAGKLGRLFGSAVILVSAARGNSRGGSRGSRRAVGGPGGNLSGDPGPPEENSLGYARRYDQKPNLTRGSLTSQLKQ